MKKGRLLAICLPVAMVLGAGPTLAGDDAAAGMKVFKKCKACHSIKPGKHKTGPSLAGIVGRKAGSTDFKRYKGLKGADFEWDEEKLDKFLENPKKFLGKTSGMTLKLKKAEHRSAVIEYLKTLK